MPFSGLMTQECWRLINNACWCETALKLTHLPSGSSEWPQPQPLVVSHSTLLSLVRSSPSFITAFPIPHHHPSHSPSSPSPFSIIVLPILHCYPLLPHHHPSHPPSSSPSFITAHVVGGSARSRHPQRASTEAHKPPAKRLFARDLKFRDFSWTSLGKKGVEQSRSVP